MTLCTTFSTLQDYEKVEINLTSPTVHLLHFWANHKLFLGLRLLGAYTVPSLLSHSPFFLSSGFPFLTVATNISPAPAAGILFRRPLMPFTAITYRFLAPILLLTNKIHA